MDISIRKWQLADAENLAKMLNNKKIQNNLRDGIPYPYTEKDAEDYINAMLSAPENDTFAFAIINGEKLIGSIGAFRQTNIHNKTAELGYYLAEEYWSNGFCTFAVKLICKYIFENTDIVRIFAEPFAENISSCRVLEKADFQFEGTLKSNAFKNNKYIDMKIYAKLKV